MSILGDGTGTTGAFLVFEFSLTLALVAFPASFGVPEGSTEASGLGLGFSVGVIAPPAGIPDSGPPVGGLAASTGWPFGSAAKDDAGVSVVGWELRVNT